MIDPVFLSASVPNAQRHPQYYRTENIAAIQEAVRATATTVLSMTRLVWGGHPTVTPLIREIMDKLDASGRERAVLYQSEFFEGSFPDENNVFNNIRYIPAIPGSLNASLDVLSRAMFSENQFSAGIFIGGMEGVEREFNLFRESHPSATLLPVASTGGAARIIYNRRRKELNFPEELTNDSPHLPQFRLLLRETFRSG